MKGLILINAYFSSKEYLYQPQRLKEEFLKKGVLIDIKKNNDFCLSIKNGNISSKQNAYDFIIYLDKDKYILNMLDKLGIKTFNSFNAITSCDDKMTTYIALANNNIPIPETYPGLLCYNPSEKIKTETVKILESKLKYPIIAKYSYGSMGKGVFLANNRKEFIPVLKKLKCSPHLFQEFIKTSYGKDLRIIVVGKEVLGGMLRSSKKDFRSNIGVGGQGTSYPLTDELKNLAIKVSEILKLDYCGIDILFGENGPVVCEVNSNAFFYSFEKVTKINVAEKLADYIINYKK